MTRKQWIRLGRLINGGTLYGDENIINKQSLVISISDFLQQNMKGFNPEVFKECCCGTYNKELY